MEVRIVNFFRFITQIAQKPRVFMGFQGFGEIGRFGASSFGPPNLQTPKTIRAFKNPGRQTIKKVVLCTFPISYLNDMENLTMADGVL